MRRPASQTRSGATRVEVAVAILALAGLAGVLLPAVQRHREAAARLRCQHNLRQIALAACQHHIARRTFPAGEAVPEAPHLGEWDGESYTCWVFPLLPYLGEGDRAAALAAVSGFENRHRGGPASLYGRPIRALVCPSDDLPAVGTFEYHPPGARADFPEGRYDAVCSYGANWGTQVVLTSPSLSLRKDGVFHYNTRTRVVDVTDGASYTVLFGERSHREPLWRFMGYAHPAQQRFAVFSRWYTGGVYTGRQPHEVINYRLPSWVEADPPRMGTPAWNDLFYKRVGSYGSEHPGGSNLAMTDGSVRFVAQSIDAATLQALATKAGREVVLAD